MRKSATIARTDIVDAALIIPAEVLAWLLFIYDISVILIHGKVLVKILVKGHTYALCYTLDLRPGKGRGHGLAAVGTLQAGHLLPSCLIGLLEHLLEVLRFFAGQFFKKQGETFLLLMGAAHSGGDIKFRHVRGDIFKG